MERPLLRTRLTTPPPPRRLVRRDRLLDTLEREVPAHRLALVSAPAGYGKTTLVAEWARESRLPVAWLAADAADAEPERFLRYLFAAWLTIQPELETALPGVLLSGRSPDLEAVLAGLVNDASDRDLEMALVIDDCDLVASPPVLQVLAWLLDNLPPSVHFVLTGRAEPSLPLARYRARQEVVDIDATDLRLTLAECREMLGGATESELADDDIERLNERLEGWSAGVQLAALGLRGSAGIVPDIAVTGRQRFIADFLRDEVLDAVDAELRRFLVATSIVDRLDASLATALTGDTNAQQTLERLERMNLFVLPLDDDREWFRYHRLFADVLRAELERRHPDEVAELHGRAAAWYLAHDMADEAFDHALAAADLPTMVEVLERHGLAKVFTGQFQALRAWLEALPESWYAQQPELGLLRVALMLYSGQFETGIQLLSDIEASIKAAEVVNERAMGRMTAMRCFIACEINDIDQAERFAEAALAALPTSDDTFRGGIWGALGDVYRRNGRWSDAYAHYLRAIPYTTTPAGHIQSVHAYGALADLELRQGHLHGAADYWRKASAVIDDRRLWGAYPLPLVGWVHIRFGEILYEWDDLDAAATFAASGRERAELGGDPRAIIAGALLAAHLHLARADADAAEAVIEEIRPIVADARYPEWSSEFERCQVELWLAQGRLRRAVLWSDEALAREPSALPDQEPVTLAIARILIVKGDARSSDLAIQVLDSVTARAEADGRGGLLIAALALRALALAGRGDVARALSTLEPALRMAEPEGYARTFLDLGLPIARLLQEAAGRGVMSEYVGSLLARFGGASTAIGGGVGQLPEPLSERELEVLRAVASGLTNREIADALFISPETVKKHTGSIYGKLGVRGRTQAVARARELGLLD